MRNVWSRGVVGAAALAAALAGVGLAARARRDGGESDAAQALAPDLSRRLEALEKGRAALESRLVTLEERSDAPGREARRPPPEEGAEKKDDDRGPPVAAEAARAREPGPSGEAESPAAPTTPELDRLLGALLDPRSTSRRQEAWREAARLGLIDEVLAAFERRVEESPKDARAHSDLGSAYLQKLNTVGEMEKGSWAMRADRSFDAALAIDPSHWEARFTKALALSYWPAITGKQPESIRQFETLIAQQESAPARPEHAKSYLLLGNLYFGQGKGEKALEIWGRGASLFPQDRELSARLEGAEGEKNP